MQDVYDYINDTCADEIARLPKHDKDLIFDAVRSYPDEIYPARAITKQAKEILLRVRKMMIRELNSYRFL